MEILEFIDSLVASIAWPVTVVTVILLLRSELPKLATSLRKFKYKDVELEFDAAMKTIAGEVEASLPKDSIQKSESIESVKSHLEAIADIAPRAAILEAWILVESSAAKLIALRGSSEGRVGYGPSAMRDNLQRAQVLSPKQLVIFEQLRHLRNEAVHVHDAEFTKTSVAHYIESSVQLSTYFQSLATDS